VPVAPEQELTLTEHLEELRKRLVYCAVAVVAGVVVAIVFNNLVFHLLTRPLPKGMKKITTFSPAEPFMTSLKVWVVTAAIVASPFLIWQFWAYVGPAFSATSKKYFVVVVAACAGLFLTGVAFSYIVVLPVGLKWLLSFNGSYFNVQNRASDYFTFVALFLLVFGLVFELPVVLTLLAKLGIVNDKWLKKNRKYAIVVCAAVAAVITPSQDAFSMVAMFIPLVILYEVSIWTAKLVQPKEEATVAGENDDLSGAPA
jgi:sec-independent protein translocase protein TatC